MCSEDCMERSQNVYNRLATANTHIEDLSTMYNTARDTIMRQAREMRAVRAEYAQAMSDADNSYRRLYDEQADALAIIASLYDTQDDLRVALDAALKELGR